MKRLLRLPILTAAAAVSLVVAVLVPGGSAIPPVRAVGSSPTPTAGECFGCVTPLDTICWESVPRCDVTVVRTAPHTELVTAHYRTVAMTARPQIDYVDVRSGTLVFQPGQATAEITIQMLPNPTLTQDRKFGVELFAVSGAGVARPTAIVTIKPSHG